MSALIEFDAVCKYYQMGDTTVKAADHIRLNGRDVGKMSRNELASIRNEMLGFIFQQYNLLPKLNLLENVELPLV